MPFVNSPCTREDSRLKRPAVPVSQLSQQPRVFRRTVCGMVCSGCCTRGHGMPTTQVLCCLPLMPSILPGCSTPVSRILLATAPGGPFGSIFRSLQTGMSMWGQSMKWMSTACYLKRQRANETKESAMLFLTHTDCGRAPGPRRLALLEKLERVHQSVINAPCGGDRNHEPRRQDLDRRCRFLICDHELAPSLGS